MGRSIIPVDLRNPGQVFACLGFLEAAHVLCGSAEGGFAWDDENGERFVLEATDADDPVEEVLAFLAAADLSCVAPEGWGDADDTDGDIVDGIFRIKTFPAPKADKMALPIQLMHGNLPPVYLGHWADGSSRNDFKLYAGNRTAAKIAGDMLGIIKKIWEEQRKDAIRDPLGLRCPIGGSFNFDPRGAWASIDIGYSPNEHRQKVAASPIVEIMAAWGLEHARPNEYQTRKVRYAVWEGLLPPILARATLGEGDSMCPRRFFQFNLELSGKNKVVYFAEENTK